MTPQAKPLKTCQKTQLEFWHAFRKKLIKVRSIPTAQTPRPQYWYDIALGRSHFSLSTIANTHENRIGVCVYIGNKVAEKALPLSEAQKDETVSEIGKRLFWKMFVLKTKGNFNDATPFCRSDIHFLNRILAFGLKKVLHFIRWHGMWENSFAGRRVSFRSLEGYAETF